MIILFNSIFSLFECVLKCIRIKLNEVTYDCVWLKFLSSSFLYIPVIDRQTFYETLKGGSQYFDIINKNSSS